MNRRMAVKWVSNIDLRSEVEFSFSFLFILVQRASDHLVCAMPVAVEYHGLRPLGERAANLYVTLYANFGKIQDCFDAFVVVRRELVIFTLAERHAQDRHGLTKHPLVLWRTSFTCENNDAIRMEYTYTYKCTYTFTTNQLNTH